MLKPQLIISYNQLFKLSQDSGVGCYRYTTEASKELVFVQMCGFT